MAVETGQAMAGPDEGRCMGSATVVDEQFGFSSVGAVLPDPFPLGVDPDTVRLPTVPRVRSPEDDDAHHRAYWRAHIWAVLHRYRRAYLDADCPVALRDGYPAVEADAQRLAQRAGAPHPISPIDSVACHAALKELGAACTTLEATVAALRSHPVVDRDLARPPTAHLPAADLPDPVAPDDADRVADAVPVDDGMAQGVAGQDFFPTSSPLRPFEFSLSLRGSRGLLRRRGPAAPTAGTPAVD